MNDNSLYQFINKKIEIDKKALNDKDILIIENDKTNECFTGLIIAVAYEKNKNKTAKKLIVVPINSNKKYYKPEIQKIFNFDEDNFKLICLYEKSCGAVLFTKTSSETLFLLIKNRGGHYGLPKGHIENNEIEIETALREIYEETHLKPNFINDFREEVSYLISDLIQKEVVYFLAEFNEAYINEIKLPENEIADYKLLTFNQAYDCMTFDIDREILKKANDFMNK